jgi:electron transport complex protein RnfC
MVYSLTKRRLRPGNLPTTQAALVLDAAAAHSIGQAARGRPLISTPLAIHDHLRHLSYFAQAAVGTPFQHVLRSLRIPAVPVVLRGGDLLRDIRLGGDVTMGGGELTIHVTATEMPVNPEPCIRCGWCGDACPTLLQPAAVLEGVQRHDRQMAQRAGVAACIECGLCSHVCPAELPLLDSIRHLRGLIARGEDLGGWVR